MKMRRRRTIVAAVTTLSLITITLVALAITTGNADESRALTKLIDGAIASAEQHIEDYQVERAREALNVARFHLRDSPYGTPAHHQRLKAAYERVDRAQAKLFELREQGMVLYHGQLMPRERRDQIIEDLKRAAGQITDDD